jgi:hypothetical protein
MVEKLAFQHDQERMADLNRDLSKIRYAILTLLNNAKSPIPQPILILTKNVTELV